MKKMIVWIILVVMLAIVASAQAGLIYDDAYYKLHAGAFRGLGQNDPFRRHLVEVDALLFAGTGDSAVWYVNSNVSTEGDGTSWTNARDTVQEAIALASAGDFVDIAESHVESGSDPCLINVTVAGLTIRHYGNGDRQGTYTFADTDTTFRIGAANVTILGGRLLAGISEVVTGFDVTAAASNFTAIGVVFPEPLSSAYEFDISVQLTSGANDVSFIGCKAYSADATGATSWLDGAAAALNRLTLVGNVIHGQYSVAPVFSDQADLETYITYNTVTNMTTNQDAIEFTGNATGWMHNNLVSTDAIGTSIDPGRMSDSDNRWDDFGTYDTTAVPWTTNETGVNRWGASELAQIEGEVEDALAVELLEKFLANIDGGSNAYPDSVVAQSMLAFLMCTGANPAITTFDNTTDSLQAIADHVQTLITTGAGTGVYPSGITNESIIAFILASGATATASTYDNTTDSLQAISDRVTTIAGNVDSTTTIAGRTYATQITGVTIADNDLFLVAGGPIMITSFVGEVTTVIPATACTTKIWMNATEAGLDYDFSTAVDMTGSVDGGRIIFTNVNPSVLTPLALGATGAGSLMSSWYCVPGMIQAVDSDDNTPAGAITWSMTWIPIVDGVTVAAQ